eukprot:TRINITY_DN1633_c0_g1_i1.p1 TRINITY_DN1633_c0_g1~~TRINITY_DN1633_c0_g1_i1.p1  ORF type:complete len:193 (-),score=52.43 TRINITY_DN1633_c0_g1_i1:35-613(-)
MSARTGGATKREGTRACGGSAAPSPTTVRRPKQPRRLRVARKGAPRAALGLTGYLTADRLQKIHTAFEKTGKRYDGELTREEFVQLISLVLPVAELKNVSPEVVSWVVNNDADLRAMCDAFFNLMDIDKSNGINFREFCLWASFFDSMEHEDAGTMVNTIFDILDVDHSGTLDAEEIRGGYGASPSRSVFTC